MISVIIPAYRARNFITEALTSAFAQTQPPLEVIVIDDASPEPVDDLLTGFNVRHIRHEHNTGLGGARNTGIHAAKGDWIAFLDHDDVWLPGHLENLLQTATRQQTDVVFCTARQFTRHINEYSGEWGPSPSDMSDNLGLNLLRRSFIAPSATMVRREMLSRLGGFDTDPAIHMCEDLDLWLRLQEISTKFTHAESSTAYYRKHADAATAQSIQIAIHTARVIERNLRRVNAPWFIKRSIAAQAWWKVFHMQFKARNSQVAIFTKAITRSLPVPWEIARGLLRWTRIKR